ncbi:MAG: hypothetical protein ACM3H8_08890 [Sphingobacteriales bacterium]
MKASPFYAMLAACMLLIFTSCGGGADKKTTESTGTDTSAAKPAEPTPVNTIVTTPENMMLARHKVKNFTAWLAAYDSHDSIRLKYGVHSYVIGRGTMDTNMVFVVTKLDDVAKAKAFSKDPSLKAAMQKGGVTGTPIMQMVTTVWQDTANIGNKPRVLTEITVKDWATWEKAFTGSKQDRLDNGIMDRVYGHDAEDSHKVNMVLALADTAKAFAYWKSDALKKRREAAGVVGEPKRFMFTIAKRY